MRRRPALLLLSFSLLLLTPARPQKPTDAKAVPQPGAARGKTPPATPAGEQWVRQTLRRMTLDEKVGQLLMVFYFGGFTSAESDAYKELMRQVQQNHVGGLILSTRSGTSGIERSQVYPTAVLTNQLQRRAKVPLLVAADFERGTTMRLQEGTAFPYAMAVGATQNPRDAYTMGRITAIEARAVGVHWIFAPVADVNVNPDNPIINTRAFGEDPQRVADYVTEFVRGAEENGALSCAKHFPGHGDTAVDSHIELSQIRGDRARLDAVELLPFRAAIAAGVSSVMTGHLAVPALDPDVNLPATLSEKITTGLLRKEMKFDGLVVTDALEMGGVTTRYAPAEVAVRAVLAGADVLLVPPIPDAAVRAVKEAVRSGRIPMSRIDESVARVLRAKARLGLNEKRLVDVDALNERFRRPDFEAAALDIADRGVTLLRNSENVVPLDATQPRRVLLVGISADRDSYPAADVEREMRPRVDALTLVRTDPFHTPPELVRLPPFENFDLIVAAVYVRVADRKGTVGLPEKQTELLNKLLESGKPVVVMSFGSPYLIEKFPQAKTWMAQFSTQDVSQRAAVRALFGQTAITGKIPVTVPGTLKAGDGMTTTANPMKLRAAPAGMEEKLRGVYAQLEQLVTDRIAPGGVLAVGVNGEMTVHAFGHYTYDAKSPAMTPDTIFDLASCTKPLVTATSIALLVQAGRVNLDTPVVRYIPEFANGPQPEARAKITVRQLLTHSSGLPADPDYYKVAKNRGEVLQKIYGEELVFEPGMNEAYSNPGYMLLGDIIERITGRPLDAVARERVFAPLGLTATMHNPPASLRARIAPTEEDTSFRKRLLQGEVQGQTTWTMGGVSGSAGLFSTAPEVAVLAEMWLDGGIYAHQRILPRRMVEQFTARQAPLAGMPERLRTLGWAVLPQSELANSPFSGKAYGHTGSTGTSILIDPEKRLFIVLLTNAAHPSGDDSKLDPLRPKIEEAIARALFPR